MHGSYPVLGRLEHKNDQNWTQKGECMDSKKKIFESDPRPCGMFKEIYLGKFGPALTRYPRFHFGTFAPFWVRRSAGIINSNQGGRLAHFDRFGILVSKSDHLKLVKAQNSGARFV